MKGGGIKTWKELTTGFQHLVRLLLAIILSTPDLLFKERIPGEPEIKEIRNWYNVQTHFPNFCYNLH